MKYSNYWPKGYQETHDKKSIDPLMAALNEIGGETCLEIGCGNGYWTDKLLVPKFKEVVAIDIIKSVSKKSFIYFKQDRLDNLGYFDAAYSFGVFCHLTLDDQMSYLKQLRPILKGKGLITFANWDRHKTVSKSDEKCHGWYYNNLLITDRMLTESGFEWYDFDPTYRDTIAIIC